MLLCSVEVMMERTSTVVLYDEERRQDKPSSANRHGRAFVEGWSEERRGDLELLYRVPVLRCYIL